MVRDAVPVEFLEVLLQLHELRTTERSPAHRTMKEDQRSPVPARLLKVDHRAALIRQLDRGQPFTDVRARREVV